jgi:hypothetical protein
METRCELNPVLKQRTPQQASKGPHARTRQPQRDLLSSSIGYKLVGTASKAHTHAVTRVDVRTVQNRTIVRTEYVTVSVRSTRPARDTYNYPSVIRPLPPSNANAYTRDAHMPVSFRKGRGGHLRLCFLSLCAAPAAHAVKHSGKYSVLIARHITFPPAPPASGAEPSRRARTARAWASPSSRRTFPGAPSGSLCRTTAGPC